ncbi:hypothetical protein ACLB2K_033257 [Fragaria x ananassa]
MKPIGKHSLLGASGEISDFQELLKYLDELVLYDNMWDDGNSLGPKEIHNYLTRVMYNRRNKFNPLWNSLVLGGVKNGKQYLGMVSMIGVNFEDDHVATGFGNHLARPILRDEWRVDLSFEEGVKLLEKCMRVLLYRDRSAVNKLQIAKITEEGVTISKPYALKTFWGYSAFQNPTAGAEGSCQTASLNSSTACLALASHPPPNLTARLASPSPPRLASPVSPCLFSPLFSSPHLTSPLLASPRLSFSRSSPPRLTSPVSSSLLSKESSRHVFMYTYVRGVITPRLHVHLVRGHSPHLDFALPELPLCARPFASLGLLFFASPLLLRQVHFAFVFYLYA